MHIRNNGYRQKFGKAWYVYFDWPVDGGSPVLDDGRAARDHHHHQPGCKEMIEGVTPTTLCGRTNIHQGTSRQRATDP
jgi:hypothetical protein